METLAMPLRLTLTNSLVAVSAAVIAGGQLVPAAAQPRPAGIAAVSVVTPAVVPAAAPAPASVDSVVAPNKVTSALRGFVAKVRGLSHPRALETAFRSYFAYLSESPNAVKKPYLYFVDYGIPATEPRGYVFDMEKLAIVDGPFMVAHGRGSAASRGVPTRFSNANGSNATSLGLYLAQETYDFRGKTAGRSYKSVGLRLLGLSSGWNDKARDRGVVAHGAPYVTPDKAGQSEGCPALEPDRAQRLLPKLANGGMVFLFAPDENWMASDPRVAVSGE
jgi:hypothetical protein